MAVKIAVGIATANRRAQLALTLGQLARQRALPERILLCPAGADDYDEASSRDVGCPVKVVHAPKGICAQRNAILRECRSEDLLIFFDDDYYPAIDYIEQAAALMETERDVVLATSHPAVDGASGPGIDHEAALRVVEQLAREVVERRISPTYAAYGCNMIVRLAPMRLHGIAFDELLPLYGWLEDVDFSRRMAPFGRIIECSALRGVHLGTKLGRTAGLRLGYSQIANPAHMLRKQSLTLSYALKHMVRNVAQNSVRSLHPEPWVDRRGRLKGNCLAMIDLAAGRLDPRNILKL